MAISRATSAPRLVAPPPPPKAPAAGAPAPAAPSPASSASGWVASASGPRASAPTVTPGLDPFTVSEAQLSSLAQGDEPSRRLAATIVNARANFKDLAATGAKISISTSPGNGGQPVVTIVPKGFDPSRPTRVHTHYHGYYSTVAAPPGDDAQVTKNVGKQLARDPQTIIVLPECASAPTTAGAPMGKTDWSNVQSITATTDDALRSAGLNPATMNVKERFLSAHSGAGRALGFAMEHTPDGSGVRADRIDLEDCCYGASKGLSCVDGLKKLLPTPTGQAIKSLTYIDGGGQNDQKPDAALKKALGPRYHQTTAPSHFAAVVNTFVQPPIQ